MRSSASRPRHVVQKFALSSLAAFQANGHRPVYPASYTYAPTPAQTERAGKWQNAPGEAVAFFEQLGASLAASPLPARTTGLSGTPLLALPAWYVPQAGAELEYVAPSYGQAGLLARFGQAGQEQRRVDHPVERPHAARGAPATNWIPSPSKQYFAALYPGQTVSTAIRLMIRMYYPTPGDSPPSILPDPTGHMKTTYVLPPVVLVG